MPISATDLNKAYLAYFGRPADLTGKTYFATLEQADVIKAFDASAESKALYGNDAAAKVNAIYQNLFNRDAEPEGLVYWTTLINQGRVTAAGAAFAILNGAQGTDATAVQNKLAASEAFVAAMDLTPELVGYSGMDAAASARNWLKAVGADAATLTAAVAGAQAAVTAAVEAGTGEGGAGYQLTNGTDVASSSVFTAGQVYTPGGNDRINSLQDEDRLTGTGTNPTLNATLGNPGDNGGTTITPTLAGIQTINVAFVGSAGGVNQLDLQDATGVTNAINITRVSDGIVTATIDNIGAVPTNLSVTNSGQPGQSISFAFKNSAVSGSADTTTVTIDDVQVAALSVQSRTPTAGLGIETINLVSSESANVVGVLNAEDMATLNITGDAALSLGAMGQVVNGGNNVEATTYTAGLGNVAGTLKTVDASALTAALTLVLGAELNATNEDTTGSAIQMTVTGGTGDDTFVVAQGVNIDAVATTNTDRIAGGEGANKLVLLGATAQTVAALTTGATLTNIQALEIRAGHDAAAGADAVTVDADAFDKLATIFVRNEGHNAGAPAAEAATFNLNDLTAAQGTAITIAHGTTGNSNIATNTLNVNLKNGTGTTDVVSVTVVDALNSQPRFNFVLDADGDDAAGVQNNAGVESVTIVDSDTESNTIALAKVAEHSGTVTLTGGAAGNVMNLDTTTAGANGGMYQYAIDGTATDASTTAIIDHSLTAGQVKIVAATVNASAYAGNAVVRVSTSAAATGAQSITMGTGNDTVIFDNANDNRAGLTISDTVVGGTGTDTLVIDGNLGVAGTIALAASEWTNVSGFENLRLVNAGAGSNYSLTLTDALIAANKDATGFLNIINDHDSVNDAVNAADLINGAAQSESAVVIDARTLAANSRFSYNGEEGVSLTADRFIMADANINGGNVINGGAVNNVNTAGDNAANGDVLEVRNAAVVTVGDLANVSNVGNLVFNNDLAIAQTLTLQLNDTVVDAMADSYHASTSTNPERLTIRANDTAFVSVAGAALTLDASALTTRSVLTIRTDDNNGAGGLDVVDTISVSSNVGGTGHIVDMVDGGVRADTLTFVGAAGELFANTTTVVVSGTTNTATLVTQNGTGLATSTHTVQYDNSDTVSLNAGGTTTSFLGSTATATFTGGTTADTIIGTTGANTINAGAGADTVTGGAGVDTIDLGAADLAADVISFTGVSSAANRDVVTSFVVGSDVLGLDVDFTTAATAAGLVAVFEDEAGAAANANGAAYDLGALTAGNTNALDLVTLDTATLTNTANANLALVTNGTELLKALVAAGAANTASGIQMDNIGDSLYIAVDDGANGYLYLASAGADNLATAGEIVLVGTFTASLIDGVIAAQTLMVA